MGNFGSNDFKDLQKEIDRIANNFDDMADKHGRDTARQAIREGVSDVFEKEIVDDAQDHAQRRANLPKHRASHIYHFSDGWRGDTYKHRMRSNDIVVASHEFGSGLHSINGRGTVDVPREGYYIPKPKDSGPIRLTNHPLDDDNFPVIAEYVTHPGVRPQRFMRDALLQNEQLIYATVGGKVSALIQRKSNE